MAEGEADLALDDLHPLALQGRMRPLLEAGFHDLAVWEASNYLAERIRDLAGGSASGGPGRPPAMAAIAHLFDPANDRGGRPRLAFNRYATENEIGEHRGTVEIIRGVVRGTRNPLSHTRQRRWSRVEALERLAIVSAMHREIDQAGGT